MTPRRFKRCEPRGAVQHRYERWAKLRASGLSISAIARLDGFDRATVAYGLARPRGPKPPRADGPVQVWVVVDVEGTPWEVATSQSGAYRQSERYGRPMRVVGPFWRAS